MQYPAQKLLLINGNDGVHEGLKGASISKSATRTKIAME
jgi:hypothetical protein